MKINLETVFRALLSNAYKMTDGEIDALINGDDATDDSVKTSLLDKDKARVSELSKSKAGQTYQDGYKAAKKEILTGFETQLKTKYGIDSDATGEDLIDAIVLEKGAPAKTTEDEVKKSSTYIQREKELLNQIRDQKKTYEDQLLAKDTEFKKKESFGKVSETALALLDEMKPILPGSATVQETYRQQFLKSLNDYDFDGEDPKTASVLKDGQLLKDAHGAVVTLADLVKQNAPKFYEFPANNGGANGGNGGGGNQNQNGGNANPMGYPAGIAKPKDFDEYSRIISDRSIKLEDRKQVTAAWEAEQKSGSAA